MTVAASRMAGVAMTAPIVADLHQAQTVAIFGLGLVGNLAGQMFGIRGCRVIGVDPVASRRALAERCGIPVTVGGSEDEVQQFILDQTNGHGADITIDAVGHSAVVRQALRATARYGQVIILGSPRVPVQGDLTELLSDIHLRFITVRGALEWQVPMYPDAGNHISQYSKQQTIFDWIQRGLLHVEPLISHRLPATEITTAYEGLFREPETYTGVALLWRWDWGLGTGDWVE
ncbi:MAG: zinc-binding dehydrogenase [Caldilineaceae bacterium]